MTIFEILEQTGRSYFRYGTVPAENPSDFFTFFNIDSIGLLPTDNNDNLMAEWYDICYYSEDPQTIYTEIDNFIKLAKQADWIIVQYPKDLETDEPHLLCRMVRVCRIIPNPITD